MQPLLFFLGSFAGGLTAVRVSAQSAASYLFTRTDGADGFVEYVLETFLRESRTFQVLDGADLLSLVHALRVLDGGHTPRKQDASGSRISQTDRSESGEAPFPGSARIASQGKNQ